MHCCPEGVWFDWKSSISNLTLQGLLWPYHIYAIKYAVLLDLCFDSIRSECDSRLRPEQKWVRKMLEVWRSAPLNHLSLQARKDRPMSAKPQQELQLRQRHREREIVTKRDRERESKLMQRLHFCEGQSVLWSFEILQTSCAHCLILSFRLSWWGFTQHLWNQEWNHSRERWSVKAVANMAGDLWFWDGYCSLSPTTTLAKPTHL